MTSNDASRPAAGPSRRQLLTGLAATAALATAGGGRAWAEPAPPGDGPPLPELSPIPDDAVDLADFAPGEQRIARHLKTLVALANSVEDTDPDTYGYITGGWWRTTAFQPWNVRIQENALTLGYFHATDRPWNPVAGDPALLARLEAVLEHWLRIQNPDGSWAEGVAGEQSTAGTGFALLFIGHLLVEVDPAIDAGLRTRVLAALQRAARWFLDPGNAVVWVDRIDYSNQVVAGLAGIGVLLDQLGDRRLRSRLLERLGYLEQNMQSPAGFYYENGEVDHGYSFGVMSRDLGILHRVTRSGAVRRMQTRYYDWAQYNQLWEPDGAGVLVNSAISGRTGGIARDADQLEGLSTVWADAFPQVDAYLADVALVAARRAAFAEGDWSELAPLGQGGVGPEPVLTTGYPEDLPTSAERAAAVATLPYVASERFTEYRSDPGRELDFAFVRRPGLYLGMSFGRRSTSTGMSYDSLRRGGLTFFWHPVLGSIVYSCNGDQGDGRVTWSTVRTVDGAEQSDAADSLRAEYLDPDTGRSLDPESIGPDDDFAVRYRPAAGWVQKVVTMAGSSLVVEVAVEGGFEERIPLTLRPDDVLSWRDGDGAAPGFGEISTTSGATGFRLERDGVRLEVTWSSGAGVEAALRATERTAFSTRTRTLHTLALGASTDLAYTVRVV